MEETILDSCHSIWIFDTHRMRYCRIVKGVEFSHRCVTTEWRAYSQLKMDKQTGTFIVNLRADRSRVIRSWLHTDDCTQCSGHETAELSIEDIREAVDF
jgi:hypothetical protein